CLPTRACRYIGQRWCHLQFLSCVHLRMEYCGSDMFSFYCVCHWLFRTPSTVRHTESADVESSEHRGYAKPGVDGQ
ncbi:hypothetical protein X801_08071, partial [Opisthorchis viverrini]